MLRQAAAAQQAKAAPATLTAAATTRAVTAPGNRRRTSAGDARRASNSPAPLRGAVTRGCHASCGAGRLLAPRQHQRLARSSWSIGLSPSSRAGVDADRGTVRTSASQRSGAVTGVEIVESNPRRVFDRAVSAALQQWRYEPTGEAFSTMAEISFSR